MKKANFFERLIAILVDGAILWALVFVIQSDWAGLLGLVYETILISQWDGQTLGKRAMGLKVVSVRGGKVDVVTAFIRSLCRILSSIFLLGYLWMLWDKNSQTWHDKIAGTYVVKA
jgi:uncharacterized RDD family membrane protein YckC